MADSIKQEIKKVENAEIVQIAGDVVNNGVTIAAAFEISRQVVKYELDLYTSKAQQEAEQRFQEIAERTLRRTESIDPSMLNRFEEPAIQFALNETYKEYIKTGDIELGENLIELLIDRLEVKDKTTQQFVIDEARTILPKLSNVNIAFLALFAYSQLIFPKANKNEYSGLLAQIGILIQQAKEISKLDINFLRQIGCLTFTTGIGLNAPLEDTIKRTYEYFFRVPLSLNEFNKMVEDYQKENGPLWQERTSNIMRAIGIDNQNQTAIPLFGNLDQLKTRLNEEHLSDCIPFFEYFDKRMKQTDFIDIEKSHIEINPVWGKIFELWRSDEIKGIQLTPVGVYLGLKYLEKKCNFKVPIDIFY